MTAAGHAEKLALLLVDDHELILLGIRQSLEREGTAGDLVAVRSAAEALQALRSRRFDLCVVDLELPDLPGFELIDAIRRQDPAARIVVNTMHNEIWTVNRLLQSGVGVKIIEIDAKRAVQLADENMRLNFGPDTPHSEVAADAVEYLRDIGDRYDLIILDPPAFAKHHKVLGNAMQGYKRLNARALSQIRPGGILFTFSCSQAVTKELFRTTVFSAAAIAGRNVRILHQLTQPADHPINIYHPEGEYLKGLVLYVE